jgi:hypothetical protein
MSASFTLSALLFALRPAPFNFSFFRAPRAVHRSPFLFAEHRVPFLTLNRKP